MDQLRSLLGYGKPSPPEPVEGDVVYQTHVLDNASTYEDLLFPFAWCFNDVLDADKLNDSLTRLLGIGDWRKLGGRLRRGAGRKLELHVPAEFSSDRPAIAFSREVINTKFEEHPAYTKVPRATEGFSFQPTPSGPLLRSLTVEPGCPQTIDDLIFQNRPALSLHVISFDDATMVTLTWPHALMDAVGLSTLLKAWSLVLAGKDSQVPPLLGTDVDVPYESGGTELAQQEQSITMKSRLTGLKMLQFAVRFIADMLIWDRQQEARVVCLPKALVQRIHRKALRDLKDEAAWFSESDALLAVYAKVFAAEQAKSRPVAANRFIDCRGRLPNVSRDDAYVQNLAALSSASLSPELTSGPLGNIALYFRKSVLEVITPAQLHAYFGSIRKSWDEGGDPLIPCGPPNGMMLIMTDWSRSGLFKAMDFGPAVVRQGEGDDIRSNPLGSPFFYLADSVKHTPIVMRNCMAQYGTDHAGNVWHGAFLPSRTWDAFEAMIMEIQAEKAE